LNTPADDDDDASGEPGPGFSPGPGFMPPPTAVAEARIELPAGAAFSAVTSPPAGRRVKRWRLASNLTRGIAIFLALGALFAWRQPGGFIIDLLAAAVYAAPLVFLLTTSKTISPGRE
jgi:hypothetical protein